MYIDRRYINIIMGSIVNVMRKAPLILASITASIVVIILALTVSPTQTPHATPLGGAPTPRPATITTMATPTETPVPPDQFHAEIVEYDSKADAGRATEPTGERKVIREGMVRVVVDDVEGAASSLIEFLNAIGGYVERDEGMGGKRTIYVRVPAHALEDLLSYIRGLGRVTAFRLSVEEVTRQYVDLRARLNASMALERRLLGLLERASTVDEVLKVEQELRRVRAEIESLQSQLKALEKRIAYSLVIVELVPSSLSYNVVIRARSRNADELASRIAEAIRRVGTVTSLNEEKGSIIVRGKVQTTGLEEVEALLSPHIVERSVRAVQNGDGWSTLTVIVERLYPSRAITWTIETDDVERLYRSVIGNGDLDNYITSFSLADKEARIVLNVPNDEVEEVLNLLPRPSEVRESSHMAPLSVVAVVIKEAESPLESFVSFMSQIVARGLLWIAAVLALSLPAGAAVMTSYIFMRATWRRLRRLRGNNI